LSKKRGRGEGCIVHVIHAERIIAYKIKKFTRRMILEATNESKKTI